MPAMQRFRTDDFFSFYDEVTAELHEVDAGQRKAWFDSLTRQFWIEFYQWETREREHLHPYLRAAERCTRLNKLMAHVYLHISYDLPRVLANSMAVAEPFDFISDWGSTATHGRFEAYVRLDAIFVAIFDRKVGEILPWPFRAARALGNTLELSRAALRAPALWVLLLRHGAWYNAEKLAASSDRAAKERELLDAVRSKATAFTRGAHLDDLLFDLTPPALSWDFPKGRLIKES